MKKVCSMLLAVLMVLTFLPTDAFHLHARAEGEDSVSSVEPAEIGCAELSVSRLTIPFQETMKWSLFMTENANQPINPDAIKFDALYELTNVELDIDIGVGASVNTKLMAAAAAGKMYDITYITNTQFRTYKTSLFYDITDRIKTDTPNYYRAVERDWDDLQLFSRGGRFYGFAQTEYNYLYDEQSVLCPQIRVDILENNSIKLPTTWREWFEAMRILKKKYPDSRPYAGRSTDDMLDYWSKMLGQEYNIYYNAENERWYCGVLVSRFKSVLQFMKDCYDEGILDQNFDVSSEANFQKSTTTSRTFFTIDSDAAMAQTNEALQAADENAMFVPIAPFSSHLNGNKTTTWYYPQSANFQSMYYIGAQANHMDELLHFMDWCYTDEGAHTNNFGLLGETYELDENGDPYVPEKLWRGKWPGGIAENGYDWKSEYGLNQFCFAPYMNGSPDAKNTSFWEKDNSLKKTYANRHAWQVDGVTEYQKGYASKRLNVIPDVPEDMVHRYDTLQTYIRNQIVFFIKGNRPMSEYDTFVNDLKAMGIEDLLDACNCEHSYDDVCDSTCNRCGAVRGDAHQYEWVIDRAATCGVNGKKHEECTLCHVKRSENAFIPATGDHTYDGADDLDCNVCGYVRELPRNGWILENGKWYYYKNDTMLKNTWQLDSVGWCYLGSDGAMRTNAWIKDSVGWCYVGDSGYIVKSNWVKDGGKWYYLNKDGYMLSNTWQLDSVGWCYLGADGAMKTNAWIKDSVGWCYVGANGYCVTNQWKKDSVGWVYLDHNGRMLTNSWVQDSVGWCYVGADGYAVTECWKKDSIGWCYLDENGSMSKNEWVKDGGKWYYLDGNGYMVTGTKKIDGKTHTFYANGVWAG